MCIVKIGCLCTNGKCEKAMDISVSHLNNRLALQLPAQLSLGLVFVMGDIEELVEAGNGRFPQPQFDLVEKEHRVRCLFSDRVALDADLQEGSTIRAGGHLVFDPARADYYLLVRDVEIVNSMPQARVPSTVAKAEMGMMMEDVRKRAEAAKLVPGELPPWVKKMAPVEYSEEGGDANDITTVQDTSGNELEKNQLAELSAAMESDEDVELTSSLLEVAKKLNQARGVQFEDSGFSGLLPPVMGSRYAYPTDVEDPDAYEPTGKSTADRILILVIIVALALFLLIMLVLLTGRFLG
jgi:hypothetical protein